MSAYRTEARVARALELSRQDYVAAIRGQLRPLLWRVVAPWVAAVVALCTGLMMARLTLGVALGAGGLVAALVAIVAVWALSGATRHLDRRLDDAREVHLDVSEEAFAIRDRSASLRVAWPLVIAWRETQDALLVYADASRFHVLPKRLLSREEITVLRRLLEERVPPGGEARLAAAARGAWGPFALYLATLAVLWAALVEALAALLGA
ncbi:MAG: YcxB family protein [Sandaracinaceae bacterium]|nr:YcxB family protein [Sandaracinaceae bacterium]